jgi:hypothetical protein
VIFHTINFDCIKQLEIDPPCCCQRHISVKQRVTDQLLLIHEDLAGKQSIGKINMSACGRVCKLVIPDNIP